MTDDASLDLDAPRGPRELLTTTVVLFGRHSGLLLSVTLLVVAPAVILVDGVWGRGLVDGPHAAGTAASAVSGVLAIVLPVLVTALHVVIVRALGDGRTPSVGAALRAAAPRLPAAVGATLIYSALTLIGFCALLVPGVWVLVFGYFTAQIAVMERAGPSDAFRRSGELVRGRWWRTAGTLLLGGGVLFLAFAPAHRAIASIDSGVAYISLLTLVRALDLSLSALFGTLLYFALRARKPDQAALVAA